MKKLIIGTLLLIAGTAVSQTVQKKMADAKQTKVQSSSATQSPVKAKTQSLDAANPNYRKEQKKYTGPDRDFAPNRAKTGARKDTIKK